jgi:Zn-dependent metalloprotease
MRLRRSALAFLLCAGCLAAPSACSSPEDSPSLEDRLEADTGSRWQIERDEAGEPLMLIALDSPVPVAAGGVSRRDAALAFVGRYIDALGAPMLVDELELVDERESTAGFETNGRKMHHLRFVQRIPSTDIRVVDADLFVHFSADEAVSFVELGVVKNLASLPTQPTVTAGEAERRALDAVRSTLVDPDGVVGVVRPAELVVYRLPDGTGRLAQRMLLAARGSSEWIGPQLTIDAENGDILEAVETASAAAATVRVSNAYYYLPPPYDSAKPNESRIVVDEQPLPEAPGVSEFRLLRPKTETAPRIETNTGHLSLDFGKGAAVEYSRPIMSTSLDELDWLPEEPWGSGAGVSAHENLTIAESFFRRLGENGWAGNGKTLATPTIRAMAHADHWYRKPSQGRKAAQFVRDRTCALHFDGCVYFCDGDPTEGVLPLSVGLDIVAHEYGHALVYAHGGLGHTPEARALNEAVADVLGAAVEHSVSPGEHNFVFGEDAYVEHDGVRTRAGARSMKSPRNFPPLEGARTKKQTPRTYSELLPYSDKQNDNGWVHANSVIASHAFYLMTVGGAHESTGIRVDEKSALGWTLGPALWHLSVWKGVSPRYSSFRAFALEQASLVRGGPFEQAVVCAWRAVEVLEDADLKARRVQCPRGAAPAPTEQATAGRSKGPGCAGRPDGWVCSENVSNTALRCRDGNVEGGAYCEDPRATCKKAADDDWTATVEDGKLVCE